MALTERGRWDMDTESSAPLRRLQAGPLVMTVLAVWATGCSARGPVVVSASQPSAAANLDSGDMDLPVTEARLAPTETLDSFMAKVRHLSGQARPDKVASVTIEGTDPELRAAMAASMARPSAENHRAVAAAYKRLLVVDKAHGALARALELAPRDALTYAALARLWRDAGLPNLALGEAYRALHFSRGSPEARNTLGTVLQALGRTREALAEFTRVVERDPLAAYGWNNLCYAWLVRGRPVEATAACQRALSLQPGFSAAQNNLGLARAQAGDMAGAHQAFQLAGRPARADFNLGVAQAATGQYALAAVSFERARAAEPSWRDAWVRVGQASRAAHEAENRRSQP